jgi:hypothetical protein
MKAANSYRLQTTSKNDADKLVASFRATNQDHLLILSLRKLQPCVTTSISEADNKRCQEIP